MRLLLIAAAAVPAFAGQTIALYNANDPVSGKPDNAGAQFTVSAGQLTVQIWNNETNPIDVSQVITGIRFTVQDLSGPAALASSTGDLIDIDKHGHYTDDGVQTLSDWSASTSLKTITLTNIGSGQPAQGIIGAPNTGTSTYSAANGSITGNGPHNPFTSGVATFVFNAPGVTTNSVISSVFFGFGTTGKDYAAATSTTTTVVTATPEPSTWTLLSFALAALLFVAGKPRKSELPADRS